MFLETIYHIIKHSLSLQVKIIMP